MSGVPGEVPPAKPLFPFTGWGRGRIVPGERVRSEDLEAVTRDASLSRGLGRAYGDAALPAHPGARVVETTLADRLLGFDPDTGWLRAEAGLALRDLNRLFLPRGWFVPVTPGTQDVTLGGMVAADVHGKNHHRRGSFGAHLRELRMRTGAGEVLRCSERAHRDLFLATQGGMGLTGHVLEVEFRMERIPSPWIHQECRRAGDLEELLRLLREAGPDWPYTVAWMDDFATGRAFGRGVVIQGRWADPGEAPAGPPTPRGTIGVPFDWPASLLNRLTGRAFYELLWRTARAGPEIVHPESFFYPLDVARAWNRMYGRRGFTQYQCVVPEGAPFAAVRALCETLRQSGVAAFLVTVKDFGAEGPGLLSFPMRGTTFAFDVPLGEGVQRCVDRMNDQLVALGGRIYLAKDLLTRPEHLRAMEPRLPAFSEVRRRFDPQGRVRSALSARLLGDAP